MSSPRLCSMLLALPLLHPGPAWGAVQPSAHEVPMDLVVALIGGQGREARVFVGALPPEIDGRVPLGQAERVVGGVIRGSGGTVVLQVPGPVDEALSAYRAHLEDRGWQRAPVPSGGRGGFQSTPPAGWAAWCSADYSLESTGLSFQANTYLRVGYRARVGARGVCDADRSSPFDPFHGLRLPDLEPPPNAVVRGGGAGGSPDHVETDADIESPATSEEIFLHYARQLAAAGWVEEGRSAVDEVAIGRWRTQDEEGRPVVAMLAVWRATGPSSHKASIRMDRPEERE